MDFTLYESKPAEKHRDYNTAINLIHLPPLNQRDHVDPNLIPPVDNPREAHRRVLSWDTYIDSIAAELSMMEPEQALRTQRKLYAIHHGLDAPTWTWRGAN